MKLTNLEIVDFRNIQTLTLSPHPTLNLLTGNNGSGKSSILEAVQCLSTGHSFRTRQARELIRRSENAFTLTALFQDPKSERDHRAGLQRHRDGSVELRLDFETVSSIAELTRLLPIKSLTPDSHKLVQEGPEERRQFLDWGLFHVEQSFLTIWRQFKRSLSQRNQLLRDGRPLDELVGWNVIYAESAEKIDRFRDGYVKALQLALTERLNALGATFHVELAYRKGWKPGEDLLELLTSNLDYHRRMKTTTDGPHRADIVMLTEGIPAKQVLSRGQQKVLVYLLHLSQLDLLAMRVQRRAIVLCDDLTSELDTAHSQQLIKQLVAINSQVFVSGVDLSVLGGHDHYRFHMEHGVAKKVV